MRVLTLVNNYTTLNELEDGKYFGEISLLSNLPATASVHTVSNTIWAKLHKTQLEDFLEEYAEAKAKLYEGMQIYSDSFFKTLHKILRNFKYFKRLQSSTIRELALKLKKVHAIEQKTIIESKEISRSMYFVYSGVVCVYIINPDTKERIPFQYLPHGSWFNMVNSILGYYSIFEIVAETNCTLLKLSFDDILSIIKSHGKLKEYIDYIQSMLIVTGSKYDFQYFEPNNNQVDDQLELGLQKLKTSGVRSRTLKTISKLFLIMISSD